VSISLCHFDEVMPQQFLTACKSTVFITTGRLKQAVEMLGSSKQLTPKLTPANISA
jgi:hypothetical protein